MSITQTPFLFTSALNEPYTYYTEIVKDSLDTQKTDELAADLLQNLDTSEFDLLQYIDSSNDMLYPEQNDTASIIPDFMETLKKSIRNSPSKHRKKRKPLTLRARKKYSLDFRKKVLNDVYSTSLRKAAQKHMLSINKVEDFIKSAIRQPAKYIPNLEQQDYNIFDDTTLDIIDDFVLAEDTCTKTNEAAQKHMLSTNKVEDFIISAIRQPAEYIPKLEQQDYSIVDNTTLDILDDFVLAEGTCTKINQDRNAFLTFLENYSGAIEPMLDWFLQSPSINAVFRRNVLKQTHQSQTNFPCSWKYCLNDLQNKNIPIQNRSELFEQYINVKSILFNCAHGMSYENLV